MEVGFGGGFTLREAKRRGWRVFGLELDNGCVTKLADKGLDVERRDILSLSDRVKYDVIAMYSVIEHTLDPVAVLRKASKLLKKSGILVLRLPDTEAKGPRASLVSHVYHFNAHTILVLLRKCGFEPLRIDSFGLWKPQRVKGAIWNMNVYSRRS